MTAMEARYRVWYERGVSLAKLWRNIHATTKGLAQQQLQRANAPRQHERCTLTNRFTNFMLEIYGGND